MKFTMGYLKILVKINNFCRKKRNRVYLSKSIPFDNYRGKRGCIEVSLKRELAKSLIHRRKRYARIVVTSIRERLCFARNVEQNSWQNQ